MKSKKEEIKKIVREKYAEVARTNTSCCSPSCCGSSQAATQKESLSQKIGYKPDDLAKVPSESNLGLGCGNPVALADLKEGEVVLDLGSGAGIDCFLAANKVGPSGRVIGVDMTPEMIERGRANARLHNYSNVEFRLGEVENLPVADNTVDVIISNCVINLSPDKGRVFREAFRVLKPGGRMIISDIVLSQPLPASLRESAEFYTACVAGAMLKDEYLQEIKAAGFRKIEILTEFPFPADSIIDNSQAQEAIRQLPISRDELKAAISSIISLTVKAVKAPD